MVRLQCRERWVGLVGAMLTVALVGARPALAQSDEGVPPFRGYYAILASMAEATEEQRVELARIDAARKAELAQWQKENDAALEAGRKAISEARDASDSEALAAARKAQSELQARRKAITDKHVAAMLAVLKTEQQHKWHGGAVYNSVALSLGKAKMSDEQKAKARAIVMGHGATIAKTPASELPRLRRQIRDEVYEAVLTDEQKKLVRPASASADEADD